MGSVHHESAHRVSLNPGLKHPCERLENDCGILYCVLNIPRQDRDREDRQEIPLSTYLKANFIDIKVEVVKNKES